MKTELTDPEKIRQLPWAVAGQALNAFFFIFTFFGSVFVLFLNELQIDKTGTGFLLSLFSLSGILAIFVSPRAARFGFKRAFLIFWVARNFAAILLLLTPFVSHIFPDSGPKTLFLWIAATVLLFSFCRVVYDSSYVPWAQEFVPNRIRGKFIGIINGVSTSMNILAILLASYVIGHYTELGRFSFLIGFGIVCGFISTLCYWRIPGGQPIKESEKRDANISGMIDSLKDKNYRRLMIGLALHCLALSALVTFVPLFLKQQVGLSSGMVVLIDIGASAGFVASAFFWGWGSDRYGSKPIMLIGLFMLVVLPILWWSIPRHSSLSVAGSMAVAFFFGVGNAGWNNGFLRYLYVNAVPTQKKTAYLTIFYVCISVFNGISPLIIGRFLDAAHSMQWQFMNIKIDPFFPLFGPSFVLMFLSFLVLRSVRADEAISVRAFLEKMLKIPVRFFGRFIGATGVNDEQ